MREPKRVATEAVIGREDGKLMSSCDVCGRVLPYDKVLTIFRTARGEKTDYCPRCVEGSVK